MRNGTMAWSHWSPPVEFVAGEPDLADLRAGLAFNEIMYNPLGQAGVSAGEFEFLELKNIGESPLGLSGLFFSSGISYIFPEGACSQAANFFCSAETGGAAEPLPRPGCERNLRGQTGKRGGDDHVVGRDCAHGAQRGVR